MILYIKNLYKTTFCPTNPYKAENGGINMSEKWFQEAVLARPPYTLAGWKKGQDAGTRRKHALSSRPKNWSKATRYRSAGRALQALANVTKDYETKTKARADAEHFFGRLRKVM
jgi:hypothetical protein